MTQPPPNKEVSPFLEIVFDFFIRLVIAEIIYDVVIWFVPHHLVKSSIIFVLLMIPIIVLDILSSNYTVVIDFPHKVHLKQDKDKKDDDSNKPS